MMGRERIFNQLNCSPVEGLAWNALVDHTTLEALPTEIQPLNGVDFCRQVGTDVIQLGDFSCPPIYG